MVEIKFAVSKKTGKAELTIEGIEGPSCGPIHERVSAALKRVAGVEEETATPTPEYHAVVEDDTTTGISLRA